MLETLNLNFSKCKKKKESVIDIPCLLKLKFR